MGTVGGVNSQPVYPTAMTDSQWDVIKDLIPVPKPGGRPRVLDMRRVNNAIFYVVVGGIQWRMLPKEYPNWKSVYHYFRQWGRDGTWQHIHDILRARVREQAGRHKHPTAGCLDSQSAKTTEAGGVRGYDAGKRVNSRKRHILVDTLGNLLEVVVHAADIQDRDGAKLLFNTFATGRCPFAQSLGGWRLSRATHRLAAPA
jgi:putative transposase